MLKRLLLKRQPRAQFPVGSNQTPWKLVLTAFLFDVQQLKSQSEAFTVCGCGGQVAAWLEDQEILLCLLVKAIRRIKCNCSYNPNLIFRKKMCSVVQLLVNRSCGGWRLPLYSQVILKFHPNTLAFWFRLDLQFKWGKFDFWHFDSLKWL